MKEDINIMFCPKCPWKLINADDYEKTNKCPKCNSWTYEIFQYYHYKGKKEIGREFGITDNDESTFYSNDYKESKRIINKAFKLLEDSHKK